MPRPDRVLSRIAFNSSTTLSSTIPAPISKHISCHAIATCSHTTKHWSALYYISSMPSEACRKFLAGACLLGNKCKYYHAPVKPTSATPPSGKQHPPAPPGSAPVTDKNRIRAKGKYPSKQTFPVTSIDGRFPYLKSNIPMKLLTNRPNINPDEGW